MATSPKDRSLTAEGLALHRLADDGCPHFPDEDPGPVAISWQQSAAPVPNPLTQHLCIHGTECKREVQRSKV